VFVGAHVTFDYSKLVIEVSIPSSVYNQINSLGRSLHTSGSFLTRYYVLSQSRNIQKYSGTGRFITVLITAQHYS